MLNVIRNFVRDEKGEDMIEYGLLAAFVAGVALFVLIGDPIGLKAGISTAFAKAVSVLQL